MKMDNDLLRKGNRIVGIANLHIAMLNDALKRGLGKVTIPFFITKDLQSQGWIL